MDFAENYLLNCPPEDSVSPDLKVFYLVENDPPVPKDFLPRKSRIPNARYHNSSSECQAYGLSVFTDIKGIELLKNAVRNMRNLKTAVASLPPDSGLIKNTPAANSGDSHHTWWVEKDFKPSDIFIVIDS
ncbi:MAG: hypothetical protein V7K50_20390 [Nostoc sp.]|uniref:hypothetical protein n=1 Tax=Nostoc sp. TaxID=1180 RepID=UPI002FF7A9A6